VDPRPSTFPLSSRLQLSLAILLHAAAILPPQIATLSYYHPLGLATRCNGNSYLTTLPSGPLSLASHWPVSHHWRSASPPTHGTPPQICLPTSGSATDTGPRSFSSLWSLSLNNGRPHPVPGLTLRLCLPSLLSLAASPRLNRALSGLDNPPSLVKLVILVIGPFLRANVSASCHLLLDPRRSFRIVANREQTPRLYLTTWVSNCRQSSTLRIRQHETCPTHPRL